MEEKTPHVSAPTNGYMKYLLFIAGLGGLLYGIDVGVVAGALPYLQATTPYSPGQLSIVVAAVLLGSVLSSLFAGMLSEIFGRKKVMLLAGVCFVLSVPIICIPQGFGYLVAGRLLQGAAAGLIGVVVPLYLAECLTADKRGSGTGLFQLFLTIGLVFAALVGMLTANWIDGVKATGTAAELFADQNFAWRLIFWICAIPGAMFTIGAFFVSESPRWLFKKGKKEAALKALQRARDAQSAQKEFNEMGSETQQAQPDTDTKKVKHSDSLLSKKYVVPFVIAVVILACTQATGINSVLNYIVIILEQAGLPGALANSGDLAVKIMNVVMTIVAVALVDRKGRKFLLTIGTTGIIIALLGVAFLFKGSEKELVNYTEQFAKMTHVDVAANIDVKDCVKKTIKDDKGNLKDEYVAFSKEGLILARAVTDTGIEPLADSFARYDMGVDVATVLQNLIDNGELKGKLDVATQGAQIKIVYKYGEVEEVKQIVIPAVDTAKVVALTPEKEAAAKAAAEYESQIGAKTIVLADRAAFAKAKEPSVLEKFFSKIHMNPFADGTTVEKGDFVVTNVEVGPIPSQGHGWIVTIFFVLFIAAYAVGPGVCVWLALSELMPTRIRSNGMSIALLINQFVSTTLAAIFLPFVGAYGYSSIFFMCAGFTVIYLITVVFFLPETKGKTLEEIEAYFAGKKN